MHAEYDFDAVIDRDSNPLMLCLQDHSRSPPRDVELEGKVIPEGSSVKISIYALQRNKLVWGDDAYVRLMCKSKICNSDNYYVLYIENQV